MRRLLCEKMPIINLFLIFFKKIFLIKYTMFYLFCTTYQWIFDFFLVLTRSDSAHYQRQTTLENRDINAG